MRKRIFMRNYNEIKIDADSDLTMEEWKDKMGIKPIPPIPIPPFPSRPSSDLLHIRDQGVATSVKDQKTKSGMIRKRLGQQTCQKSLHHLDDCKRRCSRNPQVNECQDCVKQQNFRCQSELCYCRVLTPN